MGISTYSTTAASNTALFPEGMNPSDVNDSARQVQADIRSWFEDASWTDLGHTPTYVSASSFTVTGDQTSIYTANRRVKCYGSTMGTLRGYISSSSYSSNTTVNVTLDSGSLTSNLSQVYVSVLDPSDNAVPESLAIVSLAADRVSVSGTANLGILAIAQNLTTTATAVLNSVQVSGTSHLIGPVNISGTATMGAPVDINSTLDVSGTATLTGNLIVGGRADFSGTVSISSISANPTIAGKKAALSTLSSDYTSTTLFGSNVTLTTINDFTDSPSYLTLSVDHGAKVLIGGLCQMTTGVSARASFVLYQYTGTAQAKWIPYGTGVLSETLGIGAAINQNLGSFYNGCPMGMVDVSGSGTLGLKARFSQSGTGTARLLNTAGMWAWIVKN